MSRLGSTFSRLSAEGRKALIPFITAGDPTPGFTVPTMHAMVEAGVDVIELGVPFSDPMADGPVIQRASERALEHRVSLTSVLAMVKQFRERDTQTPVVLMGYLNPIECMGYETFVANAADAGVDGVLTVDMPPEETGELAELLYAHEIDPIFLLAPNSTDDRIRLVNQVGRGFLYYVSLRGVTGASHLDLDEVSRKISHIRNLVELPIGVGFGVKNAEIAARMAQTCDAVVVGSALINKIESSLEEPESAIRGKVVDLLAAMRAAMNN